MDTQASIQMAQPVGTVPHVSARIERGQRGGYGWTLGATVATTPGQTLEEAFSAAIDALATADATMTRLFGQTPAAGTLSTAA